MIKDSNFLKTLSELNHSLESFIKDFSPFKYHGKANFIRIGNDSLYYTKKTPTVIALIYITPHLIFMHDNGDITADTLARIPDITIIPKPKIRLRGFDSRSVEFYEYGYTPVCLKSVPMECWYDFVERLHHTFTKTYYLPYLVHPFRLLRRDNNLYILSNLLHYLFTPYNEQAQIVDAHFSHPYTLEPIKEDEEDYLIEMSRRLILNFFHSLTITYLWFLNGNKGNLLSMRQKEMGFLKNDDRSWYKPEKMKNDEPTVIKPCRIKKGICQGLALFNNFSQIEEVHTYACLHLLTTLPQTLKEVCRRMNEKKDRQILIRALEKEFIIFNAFCSKIKNED